MPMPSLLNLVIFKSSHQKNEMFQSVVLFITLIVIHCYFFVIVEGQQPQYKIDIKAQNYTLNSEGKLTFDIIVQSENITINSLQFINSTNPYYEFNIVPISSTSKRTDYLYMPIDGSLEDKLNHTVKTYGTAALSSTTSATGTTSAFISSRSAQEDYIEIQNVKNFINDDFIVEFWARATLELFSEPFSIFNVNGVANCLYLCAANARQYHLYKPTNSGSDVIADLSARPMPTQTWIQLKIERKENILSLYQNGQLMLTHSSPITAVIPGETVTVYLGKPTPDRYSFGGHIDDVRIYKPENKHEYVFKVTSKKVTNYFDDIIYLFANTTYDLSPKTNILIDRPVTVTYSKELKIIFTITNSTFVENKRFKAGDRVYNLIESAEVFEGYDLQVSDAFLCCFSEFVPTPIYNPGNNQFACTKNEANMTVWKKLIDNYSSKDLQTLIHPFSNTKNVHGFSFVLEKSIFTESKTDRTCCVQSFAKLVNVKKDVVMTKSVLTKVDSPNIDYFTITSENSEKPTVSQGSTTSINVYFLVILLFIAYVI